MQHEITDSKPLLDQQGSLIETGFARRLLPVYDRRAIRAGRLRIKEWDYYLVSNGRFALALTIADNSYMGLDSVSLLDFKAPWQHTKSPMRLFPMGRTGLPASSAAGNVMVEGKDYCISFENMQDHRILFCHMDDFCNGNPIDVRLVLTEAPEESMVIATPFPGAPRHFYFNQKINCMRAEGKVTFAGRVYHFDPSDSFGTLDWGRGVWTYRNTWYWGSASGLVEGKLFGFNIGYGFGDTSAATENMLFHEGHAHKLGHVHFHIPMRDGREEYMAPWTFTSDDGRFEMDFRPVLDRASKTDLLFLGSDQHQVFGLFSGTALLDDGTPITLRDFAGFAEKVSNKW